MSCFISLCLISLKRGPSLNLELGWLVASYPHQCSYLCPSHLPGYSPHISGVTTLTSPGSQPSHLRGYNSHISRVTTLTSPGLQCSHLQGYHTHISGVTTVTSPGLQPSYLWCYKHLPHFLYSLVLTQVFRLHHKCSYTPPAPLK